ncbi:MAG: response regulator [Candidatus Eremiobacteraeota bacterium]|nr:response regulator [Candidatus Eremiobacteraeota bacterium]MCW5871348.1 response regulator [Candidatus Eremiobacteraeota bacterium]
MSEPTVRILLVEDDVNDAELFQLLFESEGLRADIERVDQKDEFEQALLSGNCDVILSDYNMPGFSGLEALRLYRQVGLEIPFLLVSGTIGEEAAVACLKAGAHDYVMKRNLKRLVPAIRRALQDYSDRAAHRLMQKRYEQIVEKASEGICIMNSLGELQFANKRLAQILGCSPEALPGFRLLELPVPLPEGPSLMHLSGPLGGKAIWGSLTLAHLSDGLVLGMLTDMTFTKQLEMQLQQAQKMEAVGRLAGGIAHDFNNLLSTIIGFTEIAQEELEPQGEAGSCFEEVLRAARRGAALTRQLLIVGRRQAAAPEVMGINHGVEELLQMLRRLLGPDVELEVRCTACPDMILLDRTHFAQVLMNLVINARDAMPTGGTIRIVTDNQDEQVRLTVSDQGVGMSEEIQASIFEPFFTTKEAGKGTGLGLSTVYSIIQQSGAQLELKSRPGEGATFIISWPLGEGTVPSERVARPPASQGQSRTILVAEDSQPVRQVFVALLERQGYQVLQAADAGEALQVEKEHKGNLDLLLSDVMMPGLKGPELARLLRARRPEMRVILTSGFGSAVDDPEDQADSFLEKPVEAQRLLESVRDVLGV